MSEGTRARETLRDNERVIPDMDKILRRDFGFITELQNKPNVKRKEFNILALI